MSIEQILIDMENKINYHQNMVNRCVEDSADWNFHLGWLDALTSYRYKLKDLVK